MGKYFINTEAIDGDHTPAFLKDEDGNRAWKLKYVSTDGWRGYYDAIATKKHGWEKVDSDFMVEDWGDAVAEAHGETPTEERLEKLAHKLSEEGYKMAVVYTLTSNVFSIGYDVFRKKV